MGFALEASELPLCSGSLWGLKEWRYGQWRSRPTVPLLAAERQLTNAQFNSARTAFFVATVARIGRSCSASGMPKGGTGVAPEASSSAHACTTTRGRVSMPTRGQQPLLFGGSCRVCGKEKIGCPVCELELCPVDVPQHLQLIHPGRKKIR